MGQTVVKPPTEGGMDCDFINQEKSGDTYIVLYKQLAIATDSSQKKRSHMAVIVDVQGKSTDTLLCGARMHLGADKNTRKTVILTDVIDRERSEFLDVVYLGRLHNPYSEDPLQWKRGLFMSAENLFKATYNGKPWSSRYNCQSFAKELVHTWGMEWPAGVVISGEEVPVVMDLAILLMAGSNSSS
jgi:hypothetical protein